MAGTISNDKHTTHLPTHGSMNQPVHGIKSENNCTDLSARVEAVFPNDIKPVPLFRNEIHKFGEDRLEQNCHLRDSQWQENFVQSLGSVRLDSVSRHSKPWVLPVQFRGRLSGIQ